jgi:hypothetical protein
VRVGPRLAGNGLPEWLQGENPGLLLAPGGNRPVNPSARQDMVLPAVNWIDPSLSPSGAASASRRVWQIEPELNQPLPRRAHHSLSFFGFNPDSIVWFTALIWWIVFPAVCCFARVDFQIVILCALLMLPVEVLVLHDAWREKGLIERGEVACAEVIDGFMGLSEGTLGSKIRVRYLAKGASNLVPAVVEKDISVSELDFTEFRVGDLVTVLYDPERPQSMVVYKLCRCRAIAPAAGPKGMP